MNSYTKITPIETNYNASADFKMRGDITVGDTGTGAITITVSPIPKQQSGIIKVYNPDDTTLFEDIKFTANSSGVLTIQATGRGKNDTTPLSEITTDYKLFFPADTDDMRYEIDEKLQSTAYINSENVFTVSPKVPLSTTQDAQVMSRKEIIDNYSTGIAGVATLNGKTGAIIIAEGADISITESPSGTFTIASTYAPPTTAWSEITVVAGVATMNLATAINQYASLVANTVMTLTGGTEGDVKRLKLIQDSTGSRTITFKVHDNTFEDADVNTTDNTIVVDSDIPTATPLIFTGADLPAPLVASTEYYAIRHNATTVKVATTKALAMAGTAVDITDVGSGTRNVYSKPLSPDSDDIVLTTTAYAKDEVIVEFNGTNYIVSQGNFNI